MSGAGEGTGSIVWRAEQELAIAARGRSAIVTAGAGSGKTGVLVECIVRSIVDDGIDPRSILAVTFTNKAAAEMKNRIRVRLAEVLIERDGDAAQLPAHDPVVETIDAYCHRLISGSAIELGLDPQFRLLARGAETARLEQRAMDSAIGAMLDGDQREAVIGTLAELYGIRGVIARIHDTQLAAGVERPTLPAVDHSEVKARALECADGFRQAGAAARDAIEECVEGGANSTDGVKQGIEMCTRAADIDPASVDFGTIEAIKVPDQRSKANQVDEVNVFREARLEALIGLAEVEMLPFHETVRSIFHGYADAVRGIKREEGALTFADVEQLAVRQLELEAASGSAPRFRRVFVDEFQDVNRLQQRLIELVSGDSYYAVGDAAQSIYGFRGSEVGIIRERERRLQGSPGVVELRTNYRSVGGVMEVNNHVHAAVGVEGFMSLEVGNRNPSVELPVELHVFDGGHEDVKGEDSKAHENSLAAMRIKRLIDDGEVPGAGDIAVLARSRSSLPGIADALRRLGISAVVEGSGGLWDRPEVDDLLALLAITGNPHDEERLLKVLRSPIAGLSVDALVLLARAARKAKGSIWDQVISSEGIGLTADDAAALTTFVEWFRRQRMFSGRRPIADAIEAGIVETGYDLHLLGLVEGERRFANVRALQMFAAGWERENGRSLRRFADEARALAAAERSDEDQEAVVEQDGEGEGSVRLLTMHGSKGLQFHTVVIPRLGSTHQTDSDRLRASADGKRALMTRSIDGSSRPLFDRELFEERAEAERQERARLLYVAMTRAKNRLILTSVAKATSKGQKLSGNNSEKSYIADIHEAIAPGLLAALGGDRTGWVEALGDGAKVSVTLDRGESHAGFLSLTADPEKRPAPPDLHPDRGALDPGLFPVRPTHLSYTGLQQAADCSFRWYVESIVGLPLPEEATVAGASAKLPARVRGSIMHAVLEAQPFDGPEPTLKHVADAAGRAQEKLSERHAEQVLLPTLALIGSPVWARLAEAATAGQRVRREESFTLLLDCGSHGPVPLRGVFDVFVRESAERALVIDWKTSDGAAESPDLAARVAADYAIQREAYALAALMSGGSAANRPSEVEVVHVYAERPEDPLSRVWTQADAPALADSLAARVVALLDGDISVSDSPWFGLCQGCPARGSICTHGREATEATRAH